MRLKDLALFQSQFTADEHILDALRMQSRLSKGCSIPDGFVVKHRDVRVSAHIQPALVGKAEPCRRLGSHFFNGLVQGQGALPGKFRQETGERACRPGMTLAVVHQAVAAQHHRRMPSSHSRP